jgi:hypothetical protein
MLVLIGVSPLHAELSGTTDNPSGTLFGTVVAKRGTETFEQAQQRADSTYGGLDISRVFYGGAPQPWPGAAGYSGRPVVVSFRYSPVQVLSGTYDQALLSWFANAPSDREVYWSYSHEPEDNIERGDFSAADYRAAWVHISTIAAAASNPHLHPTLILMCWSLGTASGRNWRDYYAGPGWVEIVAFDCYNYGDRQGRYVAPAVLFDRVVTFGTDTGIPWAIAEVGSKKIASDTTGDDRAAWLRKVGQFLAGKAIFVNYFDVKLVADYRLLDAPSQAAWREVVTTY